MRRQPGLLATAGLAAILAVSFGDAARAQHGGGHMGGMGGGHMGGGQMGGFGGFGGMSGIGRGVPGGLGGGFGGMGGIQRGIPGGMGGSLMSGVGGGHMGGMGGGFQGGIPSGMGGGQFGGLGGIQGGLPGGIQFGHQGNPGWSGPHSGLIGVGGATGAPMIHGHHGNMGQGWGNNTFIGPGGGWRGGGWGGNMGWGAPGLGWGVTRGGWGSGQLGFGGFGPRWGYGGLGWSGVGLGWGLGGIGWGVSNLGWWGYPGLGLGGFGWGYPGLGLGGFGWGYPGWGLGWGYGNLGWGLGGLGLSSWFYGPMLYNWGYSSYLNPYYMGPISVYDYSRPFDPAAMIAAKPAGPAADLFDRARVAFEGGLYTAALDFADQAVEKRPNDPTLHEFRALALFALKRYDEAAATLYPVLSAGPGWDWPTLIGFYDDSTKVYTTQIRALEAYILANPESAPAQFLLAYHYLTQGHGEAALGRIRAVVQLQPRDKLAAELLKQLEKARREALAKEGKNPAEPLALAEPRPEPKPEPAVPEGELEGTWTARPAEGEGEGPTITLDLTKAGKFAWTVDEKGKARSFKGVRAIGNGLLTLVRDGDAPEPPMVGKVTWTDDDHFTFKLVGGGDDDPGLAFARKH